MFSGIDISKDFFDATTITAGKILLQERYPNDRPGFEAFLKTAKACELVVMEATGPYYLPLAMFLYGNNIPVSVVNPLVVKRFSQMKMSRAKTDKKDSLLIAQYGQAHRPRPWEAPSATILKVQQLDTYLEGLEKRKRMVLNQLHSFDSTGQVDAGLAGEIEGEVAAYDTKIKKVKKQIEELMGHEYKDMVEYLKSIPGIGPKSAYLMVICTQGFRYFKNYRQVISYFGLSPRI